MEISLFLLVLICHLVSHVVGSSLCFHIFLCSHIIMCCHFLNHVETVKCVCEVGNMGITNNSLHCWITFEISLITPQASGVFCKYWT